MYKQSIWKSLTVLSKEELEEPSGIDHTKYDIPPSYYRDINGKEWIVIFKADYPSFKYESLKHGRCDSYLYDVKNDKFVPFIKNYQKDICDKLNIESISKEKDHKLIWRYKSYVIDNDNHVMYWLDVCGIQYSLKNSISIIRENKFVALDIKNLNDIQLIFDKTISEQDFPRFGNKCYTMLIVGHTIQFVLGGNTFDKENGINNSDGKWMHYEFDIKTHNLKLIHDNIHVPIGEKNRVTRSKVLNLFDNLEIGDWVDIRDLVNDVYLGQILDIKDKKLAVTDHVNEISSTTGKVKSMKITVRCDGFPECIDIDITNSKKSDMTDKMHKYAESFTQELTRAPLHLCDCNGKCVVSDQKQQLFFNYHRLALPNTQSTWFKSLDGMKAVYSKSHKKIIIFGCNTAFPQKNSKIAWCGLYHKCINRDRDYKDCISVVGGFVRQFETMIDNIFVNVPKDINEMILNYYFIPNDSEWTPATKKDKNGKFTGNMFNNHFYKNSGCVLVNNDNDIFIFGGTLRYIITSEICKLNIATNTLQRLTTVTCPRIFDSWYPIFCNQSQNIHLFDTRFKKHFSISLQTLNTAETAVLDK